MSSQAGASLILVHLNPKFTHSGWVLKANKASQSTENQRESLHFLPQTLQYEIRQCWDFPGGIVVKNPPAGASLVAQWLRIRLPGLPWWRSG